MKEKLANAIIRLLEKKTLDKITIKEITESCGGSRQIFYYYFEDIYDAVRWILLNKSSAILDENSDISNWKYGYIFVLQWIVRNQKWLLNLQKSVDREYMEHFLYETLYSYIIRVVEQEAVGFRVSEKDKHFIARYFTLSLNAISLDWIKNGMPLSPEELVGQVTTVINGDFKRALRRFEQKQ